MLGHFPQLDEPEEVLDHSGSSRSFPNEKELSVPALPPYLIEPIWQQFAALLPERRSIIRWAATGVASPTEWSSRSSCKFWCSAAPTTGSPTRSARLPRFASDATSGSKLGVIDALRKAVLEAYDRFIGLELSEVAVDGCITKAPCGGGSGGQKPGGQGQTGHQALHGGRCRGHPPRGITAPANRHDSPLLVPTLEHASASVGGFPEGASVHLIAATTPTHPQAPRGAWAHRGDLPEGQTLTAWGNQAVGSGEDGSWHNAHKKLLWCTERRGRVIDFWVAFSEVVIIVRRLIREGWRRYRWEGRPSRRP